MDKNHFDVIVVGFGLSGLSVAKRLEEQNKKVLVVTGKSPNASRVAGGICNPVVLKKFNLAWQSQELYDNAMLFYSNFQKDLNKIFFAERPILRIFKSVKEQNDWFSALGKPVLMNFLEEDLILNTNSFLNAPHKLGQTKNTALLDVTKMLDAYQNYLESKNCFLNTDFDYPHLNIKKSVIQYKNYLADSIIFCEGASVSHNPYFNFLPIQGNKGEYVSVESNDLNLDDIVKGSFFIIPKGNNTYKFGATYDRKFNNEKPTKEAKEQLLEKLKKMISCDFRVIDQEAGIRPTVPDRKPIIGRHPKFSNFYVCNGFGSRGILFAPTLSKQLVDAIYSDKEIPKEINASRFYEDFDEASFL